MQLLDNGTVKIINGFRLLKVCAASPASQQVKQNIYALLFKRFVIIKFKK